MIDLHTHTKVSDGELSPKELVKKAYDIGVKVLAITDHDAIDGLEEAIKEAKKYDIVLVPGVEICVDYDNGKMHLLWLYVDYNNQEVKNIMNELKESREKRNEEIIEAFKKIGININLDFLKDCDTKRIGKPHLAKFLIKNGYADSVDEAFDKYLNKEPFKSIKRQLKGPKEMIEIIKKNGGIAVLAHPQSLNKDGKELEDYIKELKEYGLDGIECYHSKATRKQMNVYRNIAKKNKMLITVGSDFHGENVSPDILLATGVFGNIIDREDDVKKEFKKFVLELEKNK